MAKIDKALPNTKTEIEIPGQEEIVETQQEIVERQQGGEPEISMEEGKPSLKAFLSNGQSNEKAFMLSLISVVPLNSIYMPTAIDKNCVTSVETAAPVTP